MTWRHPISPTPWRVGVRTGRCAQRWWHRAWPSWPRSCAPSPRTKRRIRPRWARTTGARCGCSLGRARSGPRWARNYWHVNRCSPHASLRRSRLIAREAGFSVTEAMSAPETVTGIDRVQPVLFAMQVALAAAMRSYGVRPGAVIGHSLGEVSAAVVAGALSMEDGVRVICRRSRLCNRLAGVRGDGLGRAARPAGARGTGSARCDRRRGVRGRLAAVHRRRRRDPGSSRPGRSVGAAWSDGPRGGRRRRLAFASGRSDPRRARRCAGRADAR